MDNLLTLANIITTSGL